VLSDIDGLGKAGIGNLLDEYGTVEAVRDATEDELVEIAYVTEELAPAVMRACNQWDESVPEAPGNRAARRADDPLAVDDSQLRPFSHLFNG
jgi:ERCC4-type nuclease